MNALLDAVAIAGLLRCFAEKRIRTVGRTSYKLYKWSNQVRKWHLEASFFHALVVGFRRPTAWKNMLLLPKKIAQADQSKRRS
jgi:hypothetical protein